MTGYEYLKKNVVSILKPSFMGGIGYFAVRDIKKGELIFNPWYGESGVYSITQDELFTLPEELQKSIYETFDNKLYYHFKGIETEILSNVKHSLDTILLNIKKPNE